MTITVDFDTLNYCGENSAFSFDHVCCMYILGIAILIHFASIATSLESLVSADQTDILHQIAKSTEKGIKSDKKKTESSQYFFTSSVCPCMSCLEYQFSNKVDPIQ